ICRRISPSPLLLAVGVDGQVNLFTNPGAPGSADERIDSSKRGPTSRVPLRCARAIGDFVYAAGMKRRVYRRDPEGRWDSIDKGVHADSKTQEVVGFNDLEGLRSNAVFAVGYQGEIWSHDGHDWLQEKSPTEVALTCVRGSDSNGIYAAGLGGILLQR